MNDKLIFQIIIIFFFVICFQLIEIVDSKLYFNYPSAITLSNKNIFIVHRLGVDVIDPLFTQILKRVIIFTEDEKINTEEELSKIEIKYKEQYIFVLIKDKIYIFNNEGDFLCISNDKITTDQSVEYYTLVPLKISSGFYYFVIGFFDGNNYLNLLLYKYKVRSNNEIFYVTTKKEYKFNGYSFKNKGLTCEFLIHMINDFDYINVLTCFFDYEDNLDNYISMKYYTVTEIGINDYNLPAPKLQFNYTKFIKSAKNKNNDLAFVCYYQQINNYMSCLRFDMSQQTFINNQVINYKSRKCRNKIYGLKVKFIMETNSISFSCIDYDGSLQVDFFDNNLVFKNDAVITQFLSCENIYGHSILYLNNLRKYFVLSDVLCDNNKYLLQELESNQLKDQSNIPEFEEENIEEEMDVEEEHKKEEAYIVDENFEKEEADIEEELKEEENIEKEEKI